MSEDFNQWYTEIVQLADLADYSPVKELWLLNLMAMRYGKIYSLT